MVCDEEPDEEKGLINDRCLLRYPPLIPAFYWDYQVAARRLRFSILKLLWHMKESCHCMKKTMHVVHSMCTLWLFYHSGSRCIGCQCWVDRNSISYQNSKQQVQLTHTRVSVFDVPCQLAITKSCFSGHAICRTLLHQVHCFLAYS